MNPTRRQLFLGAAACGIAGRVISPQLYPTPDPLFTVTAKDGTAWAELSAEEIRDAINLAFQRIRELSAAFQATEPRHFPLAGGDVTS